MITRVLVYEFNCFIATSPKFVRPCLTCLSIMKIFLQIIIELTDDNRGSKTWSMLDFSAEELREAIGQLGHITGKVGIEEILDVVFKDFCIGK